MSEIFTMTKNFWCWDVHVTSWMNRSSESLSQTLIEFDLRIVEASDSVKTTIKGNWKVQSMNGWVNMINRFVDLCECRTGNGSLRCKNNRKLFAAIHELPASERKNFVERPETLNFFSRSLRFSAFTFFSVLKVHTLQVIKQIFPSSLIALLPFSS